MRLGFYVPRNGCGKDFAIPRAYCTSMRLLLLAFAAVSVLLCGGCHQSIPANAPADLTPPQRAAAANKLFLNQKTFDPWVLTSPQPASIGAYISDGKNGGTYGEDNTPQSSFVAGRYVNGQLRDMAAADNHSTLASAPAGQFRQVLDMRHGTLTADNQTASAHLNSAIGGNADWPTLWQTSDVVIDGDPEAQQVTHANLFYLLSSTYPGSAHSIPPMGLSSNVYGGHIFWDADIWMLPTLVAQHPDYARPIVDYRFQRLAEARRNAKLHGFAGAEFPWESADTGAEVAPAEFTQERHITADVAWAAWDYYLWTGDGVFLKTEGWPLLRDCADYWVSRIAKTSDGQYHINNVLSPDETAGVVNDDAWTNGVVADTLGAAARAAALVHENANPKWAVGAHLARPFDAARGIPQENDSPLTPRFAAKQADALLLIHPLGVAFDNATQARMLDFYAAHTIASGPAMTAGIHAIVAARLGRAAQSLQYFRDSYRPFERGPWDAFSEKRTTNNVYFLTGMAGCVQAILYGFAGLHVVEHGQKATGTRIAGDSVAALYADPHLPPGWHGLTVQGVRFRGHFIDVTVSAGNKVKVTDGKTHVTGLS